MDWLEDEPLLQVMILEELEPQSRELFARITGFECGRPLLRFLNDHPHELMAIDDIAYHVGEPQAVIARGLRSMMELGLAERVDVAGLTLFGLTKDHNRQQLVRSLCEWQDHWQARLARIGRVVGGNRIPSGE
jgi:hypothetical protein